MICDEQKVKVRNLPSQELLKGWLDNHKKVNKVDTAYFDISGCD